MSYRTKTYLAGDWDGDKDLVDQLHTWNDNVHLTLNFTDVHDFTSSSDNSKNCSIKRSLRQRLNLTKTFVLIVGRNTKHLEVVHVPCVQTIVKVYTDYHHIVIVLLVI